MDQFDSEAREGGDVRGGCGRVCAERLFPLIVILINRDGRRSRGGERQKE